MRKQTRRYTTSSRHTTHAVDKIRMKKGTRTSNKRELKYNLELTYIVYSPIENSRNKQCICCSNTIFGTRLYNPGYQLPFSANVSFLLVSKMALCTACAACLQMIFLQSITSMYIGNKSSLYAKDHCTFSGHLRRRSSSRTCFCQSKEKDFESHGPLLGMVTDFRDILVGTSAAPFQDIVAFLFWLFCCPDCIQPPYSRWLLYCCGKGRWQLTNSVTAKAVGGVDCTAGSWNAECTVST